MEGMHPVSRPDPGGTGPGHVLAAAVSPQGDPEAERERRPGVVDSVHSGPGGPRCSEAHLRADL